MRQELITYDMFCQAIQKMQEQNEKISVRTIHSHIGGSFAKITDFLRRWRLKQARMQSIDRELSPNLKQAILDEIEKTVTDAKVSLETQLTQAGEQLEEANEALAKQEKISSDYEQQVNQLNQQLAVVNQLQTQQIERNQSLEKKLEQSVQDQHEADKRAAIAETRYTESEKQLAKYEKQIVQLEVEQNKKP